MTGANGRVKRLWITLLWWLLPYSLYCKLRDACETCGGSRGGVLGNENIIKSGCERVVMCDYCHADEMRYPGWWREGPLTTRDSES